MLENLPPFVQKFEADGAVFCLNAGNPIKAMIARNYALSQVGDENINKAYAAAFWIIEGYLFDSQISDTKYPTLAYYMANHGNSDISALWGEWLKVVDTGELSIVLDAFAATRRHVLETLTDVPPEEKKSA